MQYALPKGLMTGSILASTMLVLTGCVSAPPIVTPSSACSALIPDAWREGVEGAPLPPTMTVGDWIVFGDAQTGQLEKANGRTQDTIEIISRCEERDRKAVQRSRPKLFGLIPL